MSTGRRKYELVKGSVTGHQHYGLVVRTDRGERAFVESTLVADGGVVRADWPPVGDSLWGVVLGTTRDGRLRLSSRGSDVELARSSVDMEAAMAAWDAFRRTGEPAGSEAAAFLGLTDAPRLLQWALRQPPHWDYETQVRRVLQHADAQLRADLLGADGM